MNALELGRTYKHYMTSLLGPLDLDPARRHHLRPDR